jgi:hypothetical protein
VLKLTVVLRRKAHAGIAHSEDGCRFKLEESSRFAGRVLQEQVQGQTNAGLPARFLNHGKLIGDNNRRVGSGHELINGENTRLTIGSEM